MDHNGEKGFWISYYYGIELLKIENEFISIKKILESERYKNNLLIEKNDIIDTQINYYEDKFKELKKIYLMNKVFMFTTFISSGCFLAVLIGIIVYAILNYMTKENILYIQ